MWSAKRLYQTLYSRQVRQFVSYLGPINVLRPSLSLGVFLSTIDNYARKQLQLSARLSHRNSVRLSVTRVDQSKTVQAKITKSSSSAAWKTLVLGTVKFFHKFEGGHLERGR